MVQIGSMCHLAEHLSPRCNKVTTHKGKTNKPGTCSTGVDEYCVHNLRERGERHRVWI